jgi:carbonic anhydrase
VPLEIVLGQGIGDIFVVRSAGNLCGTFGLASLEYAVEVLHVPVLLVLGHTQCGAVKAATAPPDFKADRIEELLFRIQPSVLETKARFPDLTEEEFQREAVRANAKASLKMIVQYSSLIREKIKEGRLHAAYAILDIETGFIKWE